MERALKKVKIVSEEGDKKVYSGDAISRLNDKDREVVLKNLSLKLFPMTSGQVEGELETKDVEISSTGEVKLVDRSEDPTIGGKKKKLRLKKKTRRAKRNRRTMKRRQLA